MWSWKGKGHRAAEISTLRADIAKALSRLRAAGERPPCAVVLGEPNSGKTTIANALLADGLLPSSVIANTHLCSLLRYAPQPRAFAVSANGYRALVDEAFQPPFGTPPLVEIYVPSERLKSLEIFDTPSGISPDFALSIPILPPLRIPLWCTLATQAWKESERRVWTSLDSRWRRNGILVVTALDRLASDRDIERLLGRITREAAPHFRAVVCAKPSSSSAVSGTSDIVTTVTALAVDLANRRRRTLDRLEARLLRLAPELAE